MARCSICSSKPTRTIVDAALLTGSNPATIQRDHAAALEGISQSALYRHCRAHRPGKHLVTRWVDGSTGTGELVADLAGLRRGLFEQYETQRASRDFNAALRTAHEAHAVSATLLKNGVDDDAAAELADYFDQLRQAVGTAATVHPDLANALADAARENGHPALAAAFDDLANAVRAVPATH